MRQKDLFTLSIVLLFLLPVFVALYAGVTGKISGEVTDADTGEPVIGANVVVEGTSYGAAADLFGQYFILNIPPGVYNLVVTAVGYDTVKVTNVTVLSDHTTTQNVKMRSTVIKGEEVVVEGKRPAVEKGVTSTKSYVTTETIESMPVESVGEILRTQAGVTVKGGTHFRGGRSGEVQYLVDGMPVKDPVYGQGQALSVSTSSIQEISVQTGSFNAEYGNALSGVVNVITKEGNPNKFSGSVSYWTDDYGFSSLNKKSTNYDRFELTLSGPEPVTGYFLPAFGIRLPRDKRLACFASFSAYSEDTYLQYNREYKNGNLTTEPINTPWRLQYEKYSFLGVFDIPEKRSNELSWAIKLKQNLSPNLKYRFSYIGDWQKWYSWDWDYLYTPMSAYQNWSTSRQLSFSLTHTLSPKLFYELRVSNFYTTRKLLPGGHTPDWFKVDSSAIGVLDDWRDVNGDGEALVRVPWYDVNNNGRWDWWEPWDSVVTHDSTVYAVVIDADTVPVYAVDRWHDIWEGDTLVDYYVQDTVSWTDSLGREYDIVYYNNDSAWVYGPEDTSVSLYTLYRVDTLGIDTLPPQPGEEPWTDWNANFTFEPRWTNYPSSLSPMDQPEPYDDGEPFRDGWPYDVDYYATGVVLEETTWVDANDDGSPQLTEFIDANGNGVLDYRNTFCDYVDLNGNGRYDVDEPGEPFLDLNNNGYYDPPNNKHDDWEPYIDVNGNGRWDDKDGFFDRGFDRWAVWHERSSNLWIFKGDITAQVDFHNLMKSGFEVQLNHMEMNEVQYPEVWYDKEPDGNEYGRQGVFRSFYTRSPKNAAFYLQDKMEYGGLIANIGIRFDMFFQAPEVLTDSVEQETEDILKGWIDKVYERRYKFSPRLGMSYPITERSKLFFSYGHFYQLPGYDNLYQTPTQGSSAGRLLGNPSLDYEKTVSYEIGVAYAITNDITVQGSGYYKDIYNLLNTLQGRIGGGTSPISQSVYMNLDYARSRGIEVSVTKRYSHYWSMAGNYQYAFAYGKSSSDRSGYDVQFGREAIPLQDMPLDWDRRHAVNLNLDLRVKKGDHPVVFGLHLPDNWGANILWQWGTGYPYTPSEKNPWYTGTPGAKEWERNNSLRLPNYSRIDVKLNKDFSLKKFDMSFLVQIYNLTNRRNINSVYGDTGLWNDADVEDGLGNGDPHDWDPSRRTPERNIRVGLELSW